MKILTVPNILYKKTALECAEFVSRLMIDSDLSEKDVKIGLCLLHELLYKMIMNTNTNTNTNTDEGGE